MRIITAPDSFKGTLSAREAADIMRAAIKEVLPDAEIIAVPTADGGEGTIEALCAEKIKASVSNPFFESIPAFFGDFNGCAVIESAACCGLPLAAGRENPTLTTTYGVGELIKKALDGGYCHIIAALGGSSTNDAGCGMAAALGVRFYGDEKKFIPVGGTLAKVRHIDISALDVRIKNVSVTAMCDITNPLYGPDGAAYIFAPQKGADEEMVKRLDEGLRNIASVIKADLGTDVSQLDGAGAAGGMGAGMAAFLGAKLKSGIDVVLDAAGFDEMLCGASLVLTGEGRFDSQSLQGKVICGIAKRTKKAGIPLIAIAGSAEEVENCDNAGITAVFSIQRRPMPYHEAILYTKRNLYITTANIIRTFTAFRN